MTRAFLSLGGNLGDVAATFRSAIARLDRTPGIAVIAVASNHATRPVGEHAGDPFLNSALALETDLEPRVLLDVLHAIEAEHGRVRTVHWGPRTLDLDLLFHGAAVIDEPGLRVPHPAAWYRRFVLDPLVEIAPDFVHPERGRTVRAHRERLLVRPLPILLAGGTREERTRLANELSQRFPVADFAIATPAMSDADSARAAIVLWWPAAESADRTEVVSRASLPHESLLPVLESELNTSIMEGIVGAAFGE